MAQFTNRAMLRFNNTQINSNVAVGEIVEVLTATKTEVVDTYGRSDSISYVVSIINSGETAITGISVEDDLGRYTVGENSYVPLDYVDGSLLFFINGVLSTAPTVVSTSPLTLEEITIPADSNALLIYNTTVNEFAPLTADGSITNTVTVDADGIANPVVATETINAQAAPDLSILKSISPIPVADNGRLTYTFTIQNYGNTAVADTDDVILSDTFDPRLTDLEVRYNGTPVDEGTFYVYDEASGQFDTLPQRITVDAATYTTDAETGAVIVTPGVTVITVTGTI